MAPFDVTIASPISKLKEALSEKALSDVSDVYVGADVDESAYLAELADDIWQHRCEPFQLSAVVMPPAFPDADEGSVISGECVAHNAGYWLVYRPVQDRFYCFWGTDTAHLGAHGVVGSPLYCWSA